MASFLSKNREILVRIRKNWANKSATLAIQYEANVRAKQKQNIVNKKRTSLRRGWPKCYKEISFEVR